jgi:hypothetical protein
MAFGSIKGASKVMVVDSHPDRLKLAENWVPFLLTFERFRCGTGTGAYKGVVLIRVANAWVPVL